jgi:phosphatidylglycerophosphatase A
MLIAFWSIARTEFKWRTHDDSRIVVDEIVGQAIAVAFLPVSWTMLVACFALFRLLDIWKPLLIGWIDRNAPGAWGTLCDDLLAGALTGIFLCPFF